MQNLHKDATLQGGKYKIVKQLGQGGFGITYLGIQAALERRVAIKEFFMEQYCKRADGVTNVAIGTEKQRSTVERFKKKFLKEARNIAKLNHPHIVHVIDVFEENDTAYYVMEYAEGGSLEQKVKAKGALPEAEATRYIVQLAEALDYIHQLKMTHLDVKPGNVMLNEKDEAVLIDFGLSKQYDVEGKETTETPMGISQGYAPMEQYLPGGVGEFSPETDIYALGATFYNLLTGSAPPNVYLVNNKGLPTDELQAHGVSARAISVISLAMKSRKEARMRNVRAFIVGLTGQSTSKYKLWIAAAVVAVVCAVVGIVACPSGNNSKIGTEQTAGSGSSEVKKVEHATIVLTKGHESKRNFVYSGEVDDQGLPHGKGRAEYPETKSSGSSVYEGAFVHGITSKGTLTFNSGACFKGTFDADGFYKEGTWTETDGYYFEGIFKNGDAYDGWWYTPQGQKDGHLVEGKDA